MIKGKNKSRILLYMNTNVPRTWFEKLRLGSLMVFNQLESEEPEYVAINQYSDKTARWSKINQYASDLDRIIKEMELSISLLESTPDERFLMGHKTTIEDFVMYHQSYFLELVHQSKDKILMMTSAILFLGGRKYEEPRHVSAKHLSQNKKVIYTKNLSSLIGEWDEEGSSGGIAKSLLLRKNHHHFRSPLPLNSSFLDAKLFRTMQQESVQKILSDYGKQAVSDRWQRGIKNFQAETLTKMKATLYLIKKNLESISEILCKRAKLLYHDREVAKIFNSFKILRSPVNSTSIEKAGTSPYFLRIDKIKNYLNKFLGGNVRSFYLVGSVARGEDIKGVSDVNLVLIVKEKDLLVNFLTSFLDGIQKLNFQTFTEEEFKEIKNFKARFVCRFDGLLLLGDDLIKDDKFPSPGLGLAFLLNEDYRDYISRTIEFLRMNQQVDQVVINKIVRETAKRQIRLLFGVVMANKTIYCSSIKDMKTHLILDKGENMFDVLRVYGLATGKFYTSREGLEFILKSKSCLRIFNDELAAKSKDWYKRWLAGETF